MLNAKGFLGIQPSTSYITSGDAWIKAVPDQLEVFKSLDGEYKWLVVSSNAYEDREKEIVSQAALEADVALMEETKEYGPLRWWHMGEIDYRIPLVWHTAQAGQGIDIGDCTFAAMHGRMLVEGGTFRSKAIAEAVARIAPELLVSRGFTHPPDEPQAGVYHHIKGVERSLLPAGREANTLTALAVTRGLNMATLKEKWDTFTRDFFGGDEAQAKAFAGQVSQKDFNAEAAGQAFKQAAEPADVISHTHDLTIDPAAHTHLLHSLQPEPATVKDAGPMETVDEPASEAASDNGPADGAPLVGDMTFAQLVEGLAPAIANAIAAALAPTQNELTATKEALGTAQRELASLKSLTTKETTDVAGLAGRVAALEGDAPSGVHIPSRDNPAKTKEDLDIQPKAQPNDIDALVEFWTKPVASGN